MAACDCIMLCVDVIIQKNGFLPIHAATAMGHISVVKKLVEKYNVSAESITLVCIIAGYYHALHARDRS